MNDSVISGFYIFGNSQHKNSTLTPTPVISLLAMKENKCEQIARCRIANMEHRYIIQYACFLFFVFCFCSVAMHTSKSNISFNQAQYLGREPMRAQLIIEFPQLSKYYFPLTELSVIKGRNCRLLIHGYSLSSTAYSLVLRKLKKKSQTAHSLQWFHVQKSRGIFQWKIYG